LIPVRVSAVITAVIGAPLSWTTAEVLSYPLVTVKVVPLTPVTNKISLSILTLKLPLVGNLVALATTRVVATSVILPFRVEEASFVNCSAIISPYQQVIITHPERPAAPAPELVPPLPPAEVAG
jgi:hypothetical protein